MRSCLKSFRPRSKCQSVCAVEVNKSQMLPGLSHEQHPQRQRRFIVETQSIVSTSVFAASVLRKGQPVCLAVRGNVVAVLTQANMRPRTRQLRLISQEIALEFSCAAWVDTVAARVMVQPMTFFYSSFLFERGNTCVPQSQTLSCQIAPWECRASLHLNRIPCKCSGVHATRAVSCKLNR